MSALRVAITIALVGLLFCLWLLVAVNWYTFVAFMMLAQPLLVLAMLVFIGVMVRQIRQRPPEGRGAPR